MEAIADLKWEELGEEREAMPSYGVEQGHKRPNPILTSEDVANMAADEVEWLVEGLIPLGAVVLVAAPPGTYKTWLALCLARSVASGEPFAGRACRQSQVFYMDRENPRALLSSRVKRVGPVPGFNVWPLWSQPGPPPIGDMSYPLIADGRPLIVFDSLVRFHESEENSSTEMARVMNCVKSIAARGATVLVLHHKGKNESDYRGSSEILAGVQVAWSVRKRADSEGVIELKGVKNHYAPEEAVALRFHEGDADGAVCFMPECEAEEDTQSPWEKVEAMLSVGEKTFAELSFGTGLGRNQLVNLLNVKEYAGKVAVRKYGQGGKKLYSLIPF